MENIMKTPALFLFVELTQKFNTFHWNKIVFILGGSGGRGCGMNINQEEKKKTFINIVKQSIFQ